MSRLVYSTEFGRACPGCGRPVANCACKQKASDKASAPAGDGIVRVSRETKGRGGKAVVVVSGLPEAALAATAKSLKAACGCGGTVKNHTIELQGEVRDRVIALLEAAGHRVKRAGG